MKFCSHYPVGSLRSMNNPTLIPFSGSYPRSQAQSESLAVSWNAYFCLLRGEGGLKSPQNGLRNKKNFPLSEKFKLELVITLDTMNI